MTDDKASHVCGFAVAYVRLVDLAQGSLGCTGARSKRKRVTSAVTVNDGCYNSKKATLSYTNEYRDGSIHVQPLYSH